MCKIKYILFSSIVIILVLFFHNDVYAADTIRLQMGDSREVEVTTRNNTTLSYVFEDSSVASVSISGTSIKIINGVRSYGKTLKIQAEKVGSTSLQIKAGGTVVATYDITVSPISCSYDGHEGDTFKLSYTGAYDESFISNNPNAIVSIYSKYINSSTITINNNSWTTVTYDYQILVSCVGYINEAVTISGTTSGEIFDLTANITAHDWSDEPIIIENATCTEDGYKVKKCSLCDTEDIDSKETIPALGHLWDSEFTIEDSTCTDSGSKYIVCKRCSQEKPDTREEILPKGHTETEIPAIDATCEKTGSTAGKKCSACGLTLEQPQEIPAIGHKWDEGKITQSPTSSLPGTRTYTCSVCGETKTEEVPKLPAEEKKQDQKKEDDKKTEDKKTDTTQPSTSSQTTPETYSFEATVQENTGSTVQVKGLSTNNVNYRGSFYLTISKNTVIEKNGAKIDISKLTKGTQVTVYYSGTIAETSPGQIFDVRKIVVTKEATTPKTTKAPSKPTLSPLKNTKGQKMVIKWKKVKNAKGYQVKWALDSKFKKSKKSKTLSQLTFTAKNLKKSKVYYVRVRAYKTDAKGKKVYGKWSTIKKVTIKK